MLCVQASLLAAGSLDPQILGPLAHRPQLARRYLAIEAHRALAANDDVLPPGVRPLVDHDLARRSASAADSLALARVRWALDGPPATFGTIRARRALAVAGRAVPAATPGGPRPADPADLRELPKDEDDDPDGDLGQLLASPVGGGGPAGRLLARLLRPARARPTRGPPGADAPTHVTRSAPGAARRAAVSAGPTGSLDGPPALATQGVAYPEWDVARRRYRPDWCTVTETDPPPAPATTAGPDPAVPEGHTLRRPLARLGLDLARCRRQPQGDDIDVDAAVEAQLDTLAGRPHGDDVYLDSLRRRRDLAVLVLLDVSGSAGEPGVAGRSVHDHQAAAAAGLTVALHGLGDRVALYGFRSRGRSAVEVLRVKAFDDRLDGAVAARLAALTPAAYTRLGAAVRHGTAILEARSGTPRRLLAVVSDGFAYDNGYDGRYGEADARRALVEARRRGIGCVCLSVGAATEPAALRRVFGPAVHASVPRADGLPALIGPLFRTALRAAASERRRHGDRAPTLLPAGR
jgi:Mg-chelatase subunit ChlD